MAFDSKYVSYGLAKPEKTSVKIYRDRYNYLTISIGEAVNNVLWSGDQLNVFLANGKVRKYRDQFNYLTI